MNQQAWVTVLKWPFLEKSNMLRSLWILLFFHLFLYANNGWNELHKAVYSGDTQVVLQQLKQYNINSTTNAGLTPLHMAVKKRDLNMVKFLLSNGADVDAQDNKGFSVLYYAVLQNNIPIARYLLQNEADTGLKNNIGNAPMHNIAYNSRFEMLELFMFFGANANIENNYGMKPYDFAAKKGNKGMMGELKSITKDNK